MTANDPAVAELGRWLEQARRIVVFTGAGISTESGIPDFRSPGGLWSRLRPVPFQEFLASEDARRAAWALTLSLHARLADVEPNRGHRAVAELARRGKLVAVITQNIDGLHQRADPAQVVIELHGTSAYAICLDCGARYEIEPIRQAFEAQGRVPYCTHCGGPVKAATISFGQAMPQAAMAAAERATRDADLFLVLGSSLVVHPAAGLVDLAKLAGARVVIVNREATDYDAIADLVVGGEIGAVLGAALGMD